TPRGDSRQCLRHNSGLLEGEIRREVHTGLSIVLLLPANVLLDTYMISAVIAYTVFGVGLAFYATPSTDAALANLPAEQAGGGSGSYARASSLGAAFGVAISAAIVAAFSANDERITRLDGGIAFAGSDRLPRRGRRTEPGPPSGGCRPPQGRRARTF